MKFKRSDHRATCLLKQVLTTICGWVFTRIVDAVKICAPVLILWQILKTASDPAQSAVAPYAIAVGELFGLPEVVSGSRPACVLLIVVVLLVIGSIFATKAGKGAMTQVEALACKLPPYKAVRNLVKWPKSKSGPQEDAEVVWHYSAGGWHVWAVKHEYELDGERWYSLVRPSVPMPTGWSVMQAKVAWTGPAGLTWTVWQLWQAQTGGPLPAGAIPQPSKIPAELRNALPSS